MHSFKGYFCGNLILTESYKHILYGNNMGTMVPMGNGKLAVLWSLKLNAALKNHHEHEL